MGKYGHEDDDYEIMFWIKELNLDPDDPESWEIAEEALENNKEMHLQREDYYNSVL